MQDEQNDNDRIEQITSRITGSTVTALVAGALAAGIMSGALDVPPWALDVLRGGIVAGLIGYAAGGKLADLLSEPPDVTEVVEVDAERDVAQTWFVPPDSWESRVEDDDGAWFRTGSENWGVRELGYDDEADRAVVEQAPLRSELNDDELETWHSAVYTTRGQLRDRAREGEFIKLRLPGIGQSIEHEVWDAIARMQAEKRNIDPDAVFGTLDDELGEVKATLDTSDDETEEIVREVMRDYSADEVDSDSFDRIDEEDFDEFTGASGGDAR